MNQDDQKKCINCKHREGLHSPEWNECSECWRDATMDNLSPKWEPMEDTKNETMA